MGKYGVTTREVVSTPTREVVYEAGQPPRDVRNGRTLLGRWGVRPPTRPYQLASYAALAGGLALAAARPFVGGGRRAE